MDSQNSRNGKTMAIASASCGLRRHNRRHDDNKRAPISRALVGKSKTLLHRASNLRNRAQERGSKEQNHAGFVSADKAGERDLVMSRLILETGQCSMYSISEHSWQHVRWK